MKVVVTCDQLLQRKYSTSVVEAVISIFEEADIYTLAHDPAGVLGPTALRKVHSSFLSSVIENEEDKLEALWSKNFLFPSAAKKLTIPCSVDLVINISSGVSHGIECCDGVYQITYLLEDSLSDRKPSGFFEKIFRSYLKSWSLKKLNKVHEIWYPYDREDKKALLPFIKLEDFPLFPESQHKIFPHDFVTVDAASLNLEEASALCNTLDKDQIKYRFIGADQHLSSLKRDSEDKRFFGERCSGELAPMLAASRAHLTWNSSSFPTFAIQSLSCGVPVITGKDSTNKYFYKEGLYKDIEYFNDVKNIWDELPEISRDECHNFAKRFHEIKFKAEVRRRIERIDKEKIKAVRKNC